MTDLTPSAKLRHAASILDRHQFGNATQDELDLARRYVMEVAGERAAIVAWLRGRADSIEALMAEATTEGSCRELELLAQARRIEADAIERGDHLPSPPDKEDGI